MNNRLSNSVPSELARKALKILGKMQGRHLVLRRRDDGATCEAGDQGAQFAVFSLTTGKMKPRSQVTGGTVTELLHRDWIEKSKSGFRLTAAGAAWLRRMKALEDGYRAQHQCRIDSQIRHTDGSHQSVSVDAKESPLHWLRQRKNRDGQFLINEPQFLAGERLRHDFERSQWTPRVTQGWDREFTAKRRTNEVSNVLADICDSALTARERVHRALEAVGPELSAVLIDVCCHLNGIEEAERLNNWPRRSGKILLQLALTRLARHYGLMTTEDVLEPVTRRIRHWGDDNYRPTIDNWV